MENTLDRTKTSDPADEDEPDVIYAAYCGDAKVTVDNRGTVSVNDHPLVLAPQLSTFLLAIAKRRGRVCTSLMITAELYPDGGTPNSNLLKVYACRARKMLHGVHPDAKEAFRGIWGRGYIFGYSAAPVPLPQKRWLPRPDCRWSVHRKAEVVSAIDTGKLTVSEALAHYPDLTVEEIREWRLEIMKKAYGN